MPEASGSEVADESDYSIFENKAGLAEDMKFLASMPELCDVTFLVGDTKEPICAVKAVLAARSRVFQKMFYQAPSPQRKKEPAPKENKIRLFLKRSSEPLLNLQNAAQQRSGFAQQLAPIQEPNQHHTVIIEEFEPDVFRQLIEYIHTGCVTLQPRTLLGLMNAADYYGLEQLRKACTGFVQCCITVDTVCALLASAERYIQYKCTKSLVHKVFEFVDEHGNEVLNLGSFTLLPQHVVRLILAREELRADEFTKFQAALMWSKKYCDSNQNQDLKDVIGNFLEYIQFHKIPANVLMREVHPLGLVPSGIIVNALAYQADPTSVDPGKLSPHKVKHQDRSLSVQSSLQDQFGSNTSLSSTGSYEGSDEKQHSGKYGIAEQEIREKEQWQKHRQEEEDLQRLIEQRSQYQSMRQDEVQRQHDEQLIRRQEEELRRQEMQEEFERRQKSMKKKKQEEELKRKRAEEELKRQREEEEQRKKQEEESKRQREEEEKRRKRREEEEEEKGEGGKKVEDVAKLEDEKKKKRLEVELRDEEEKKNLEKHRKEKDLGKADHEEIPQKRLKSEEDERRQELEQRLVTAIKDQDREESIVPKEEEKLGGQLEEERRKQEELLKQQKEEEQRRIREEKKMQLQLEELKAHWTSQQEVMLRMQEEALQRQIEERRYEDQWESRQFQQLQLHIEGRKPEAEKKLEQRQTSERKRGRKRKEGRVEIRVHEVESPKREQQLADGVTGFYIKIVVRQEGRANLVWLFKTHKF
ncbi:trichohyalin isoform X1 [Apis florea]|uniref:trichohyalin isoform X1 n=1 Tax=Apis florea TaxID=7463 RepID=UPI000629B904|nr:trichohyalin isoform X1 [Apis florea]XP_031772969.1 trichohyalin isoform X1 [Apis florea]